MDRGLEDYLYPGIDELHIEDVEIYKIPDLVFLRGLSFANADDRSRLYNAIHLHVKCNFAIFTTKDGVVVKINKNGVVDEKSFDRDLKRNLTFTPIECSNVKDEERAYYFRLMDLFRSTLEFKTYLRVVEEYNGSVIYLSMKDEICLKRRWRDFISGTPFVKVEIKPWQIKPLLQLYPNASFQNFPLTAIIYEPYSHRVSELKWELNSLEPNNTYLIDVKRVFNDERETRGAKVLLNDDDLIPLMGTSLVATPSLDRIMEILVSLSKICTLDDFQEDEIEVFTQTPFNEMNNLQLSNLIKVPSGNYYSGYDLEISGLQFDPLTREPFPDGYVKRSLEPELFCLDDSFYIRYGEMVYLLWKINEDFNIEDATNILVIKWSDGSLFGSIKHLEPQLMLSPKAYVLFEPYFTDPSFEPTMLDTVTLYMKLRTI